MVSLLERRIASIDERLVLLAPPDRNIPSTFSNVQPNGQRRDELVTELQRFRGAVYLNEGAVHELSDDGCHRTPEDEHSWHVVRLDGDGRVRACIWYLEHDVPVSIDRLRVRDCPLAADDGWRDRLHSAVASELNRAESDQVPYAEIGGWAASPDGRCPFEGIILALSAFSLGRLFGGALGMATATARHASASMLRRLGGNKLESDGSPLPAYYDHRYNCDMELLRFDSRRPHPKYDHLVDALAGVLANVRVLAPDFAVTCAAPAA